MDLTVTVTGDGDTKTATATAPVAVGIAPLPEIVKIEAVGAVPLLDDNGDPLSAIYWDSATAKSNPIAAATASSASVSADVHHPNGGSVQAQSSFVVTKLKFTLRLPPTAANSTTPQEYIYRGVIPALGQTATNPAASKIVVPDFAVTFPANQREAPGAAELRWSGGEVRSAKLAMYAKRSADSSYSKAAYRMDHDPENPDLQNVFLPFAQPKQPLAGQAIPVKVMERACTYADGSSSEPDVRAKLNSGLFGWLCWQHPGYYSPNSGDSYDRTYRTFNLEKFMNAPAEQCTATAAFLEVHCSAIGVEMQNQDIYPTVGTTFRTRSIVGWGYPRWGRNPTTSKFPTFPPSPTATPRPAPENFIFHQPGVAEGKVYELSFAVPGPSLLVGMGLADYIAAFSDPTGTCRAHPASFRTRTVWMESR